jgi:hypothetical protein
MKPLLTYQGAAEAMALAGASALIGRSHHEGVAVLADGDPIGKGATQFSLGTLDGDGQAVEADAHLVGNADGGFTDT